MSGGYTPQCGRGHPGGDGKKLRGGSRKETLRYNDLWLMACEWGVD
jgi:hypothetical protein